MLCQAKHYNDWIAEYENDHSMIERQKNLEFLQDQYKAAKEKATRS